LGGNDIETAGNYVWNSTGLKVPDSFWTAGEPNDSSGHLEDCVHMWKDLGEWNDKECNFTTNPQATMCEKIITC
jgi:hypothetical protein